MLQLAGEENRPAVEAALAWRRIVGEPLARRSRVEKFEFGTLHVAVDNNVWMQELMLLKQDMLHRLNKLPGLAVQDIKFFLRPSWRSYL